MNSFNRTGPLKQDTGRYPNVGPVFLAILAVLVLALRVAYVQNTRQMEEDKRNGFDWRRNYAID